MNIFIDILLLVLPIPIVLRLRLGWRVRLGLVAMFSMGFLFVVFLFTADWGVLI